MKQNKMLSLLGLAKRAGKVVSGEFSVEKAVKSGRACLVIVAEDASANTRKSFKDMCTYYKCPLIFTATKDELGHAIGCEFRASAAVMDSGFAQSLLKHVEMDVQN